ncbi:MAG: hypothetical protein GAK34_03729 [Delftia tsuruhatensis]|nr:MAG: hypothetical protein GAK34_03729 [Delftia tsuruhatensis]
MPRDHLVEALGKPLQPLARVEAQRVRGDIGIALGLQQVVEQNSLLQRRQRVDVLDVGRASRHRRGNASNLIFIQRHQGQHVRRDRRAAFGDAVGWHVDLAGHLLPLLTLRLLLFLQYRLRKLRQPRVLEQRAHLHAQALGAHALQQAQGEQRMPAQLEEAVLPAHAIHAQHVRPDLRQRFFQLALWCLVLLGADHLRLGQRLAVHLAVGSQRQGIEHDDGRGHHVVGQRLAQALLELAFLHRVTQGDIGDQPCTILGQHHRLAHLGLGQQLRLHLAQLDTEAPDLDLLVGTAQVFEFALSVPAHQVARAVQALARLAERVGNEALCRQSLPVEIAACQALACHVQLSRHALRQQVQAAIQHIQAQVRNRHAHRAASALQILPCDLPVRHMHRGLGDAVHVDELGALVTEAVEPGPQALGLQRLAAKDHLA